MVNGHHRNKPLVFKYSILLTSVSVSQLLHRRQIVRYKRQIEVFNMSKSSLLALAGCKTVLHGYLAIALSPQPAPVLSPHSLFAVVTGGQGGKKTGQTAGPRNYSKKVFRIFFNKH